MALSVTIAPVAIQQVLNNAGQPNAGGSILTSVGGAPYPTYQDQGVTPLPNPIPLNSRGEISNASGTSCQLFLVTGIVYTFTYYDANGNQFDSASYVTTSPAVTQSSIGQLIYPETPAETLVGVTIVKPWVAPENVTRYGAVGDGVTDNTAFLSAANGIGQPLFFPAGTYFVASNLTLSAPLTFDGAAILKPASGKTITINAAITNGLTQIFNTILGGTIAGNIRANSIPVEWFGAKGDGKSGNAGVLATVSTAFTDASAAFAVNDVGKDIFIVPPKFSVLPTYIGTIAAYVSATAVTLSAPPVWASSASFTATSSTTTLSVSAVASGTIYAGQVISSGAAAGTVINYQLTGTTGGVGTYNISISQSIASATAMASSSPLSYYYGTDDTAAITAANGTVGTIVNNISYAGDQGFTAQELAFSGGRLYLMSAQAVIGSVGVTAAQWKGIGGSAGLIFGIASSTTNCISFGIATADVGATSSLENFSIDACFSGQDLCRLGGFQSPRMRNILMQNAARDALSITPPAGSFIQQGDFQNVYLGPAGRHDIYVLPAAGSFANEIDFSNLDMQYPSVRQANGTALFFDTTTGGIDSWTITNYKASTGWNGDPNYAPLGSWCYINSSNAIFATAGLDLISGYCEQGVTTNPIGATTAPIKCAAGSSAMITVRGFYASYWGYAITHADHDAASGPFTVLASGTQVLVTNPAFFAYVGDFVINITDGTNSDYFHFQAVGGKNGTGSVTTLGSKLSIGTPPTYTITEGNTSNQATVTFNNTGAVTLTVNYSARTLDCAAAPIYTY